MISEVVEVNVTRSETLFTQPLYVYPNPFVQTVSIIGAELTGKNFSIIDQLGRVVMNGKFESDNQEINLDFFLPGFYSVIIPERSALRLIKIN